MSKNKRRRARLIMRDVMLKKRAMTAQEEKFITKYSLAMEIDPIRVITFLRGQHTKTSACGSCACPNQSLSPST